MRERHLAPTGPQVGSFRFARMAPPAALIEQLRAALGSYRLRC